jgi:uncharacterized RDD family membrane protein YckC
VSQPSPWARPARPRSREGECDPFRRIGARVIDVVVLTPFAAVLAPLGNRHDHEQLVTVALLAIGAVYEIVAIGLFGRTVGKLATHIRVVSADGARATWAQAAVRWAALLGVAIVLGTFLPYLGIVWGLVVTGFVLFRGLGPHDYGASTKVITDVHRPPRPVPDLTSGRARPAPPTEPSPTKERT